VSPTKAASKRSTAGTPVDAGGASDVPVSASKAVGRASQPDWVKELRKGIRVDNGAGWSVKLPHGKRSIQIQWQWGDRNDRERVNLPADVEWSHRNHLEIRNIVKGVHDLIEQKNCDLKTAVDIWFRQEDPGSSSKVKSFSIKGWQKAADDFLARQEKVSRPSTVKELRRSVNRTLEALSSKPAPRSGKDVLQRYAKIHFYDSNGNFKTPRNIGRKRAFEEASRFLRDAVAHNGAPERFLPPADPGNEFKMSIIGKSNVSLSTKRTIPLLPEQFSGFLDWLESNDMPELRLAVGLVGYYGLRECEIAVMYPSKCGGHLEIGSQCKENARQRMAYSGGRPPRKVHHLAVKGRPVNEAKDMLAQYAAGLVKLPDRIQDAIDAVEEVGGFKDVGIAFSAEIRKTQYWKNLTAQEPGLRPNGLRHGFAYRAHCTPGAWIDYVDAAAWMGHDKMTHIKYYASWTNESKKMQSASEFNAAVAAI
jgi:hypothetical protein